MYRLRVKGIPTVNKGLQPIFYDKGTYLITRRFLNIHNSPSIVRPHPVQIHRERWP